MTILHKSHRQLLVRAAQAAQQLAALRSELRGAGVACDLSALLAEQPVWHGEVYSDQELCDLCGVAPDDMPRMLHEARVVEANPCVRRFSVPGEEGPLDVQELKTPASGEPFLLVRTAAGLSTFLHILDGGTEAYAELFFVLSDAEIQSIAAALACTEATNGADGLSVC